MDRLDWKDVLGDLLLRLDAIDYRFPNVLPFKLSELDEVMTARECLAEASENQTRIKGDLGYGP